MGRFAAAFIFAVTGLLCAYLFSETNWDNPGLGEGRYTWLLAGSLVIAAVVLRIAYGIARPEPRVLPFAAVLSAISLVCWTTAYVFTALLFMSGKPDWSNDYLGFSIAATVALLVHAWMTWRVLRLRANS